MRLEFIGKNRDKPFAVVVGYKVGAWTVSAAAAIRESMRGRRRGRCRTWACRRIMRGSFREARRRKRRKQDGKQAKKKDEGAEKAKAGNRTMLQGYFGCLAAVDENVGRLLARLDDLKLAENTVVVFTSDNGYYLGEHNLGDKRSAYEESMRIPMLVRYPKLGEQARGKTVDKMVLNLDIAPTFLDLAGDKAPETMQGKSWRPLVGGQRHGELADGVFLRVFLRAELMRFRRCWPCGLTRRRSSSIRGTMSGRRCSIWRRTRMKSRIL